MSPEQVVSRRSWDQFTKIISTWIPVLHWTTIVSTRYHSTGDSLPGQESCAATWLLLVFGSRDTCHSRWMPIGEASGEWWIQDTVKILLSCPAFPFLECSLPKQLNMLKLNLLLVHLCTEQDLVFHLKANFGNLLIGLCTIKISGKQQKEEKQWPRKKRTWDKQ